MTMFSLPENLCDSGLDLYFGFIILFSSFLLFFLNVFEMGLKLKLVVSILDKVLWCNAVNTVTESGRSGLSGEDNRSVRK